LAPRLRYYGKKRGDRRTGSHTLGSAADALFYAIFLLIGCGGLAALIVFLVVPEWRVNNEFVECTCTVTDRQIAEKEGDDGKLYRAEIEIEYEVGGVTHVKRTYDSATAWDRPGSYAGDREAAQQILDQFVVGEERVCWYDPADSNKVVLVRGNRWWIWIIFIIPVSFIVIGGGGLIYRLLHWGKSAEYRAAMAQRGADRNGFSRNGRPDRTFPNIPAGADITNSPGTTLAYRLPISASPGWKLFGILLVCLFWNGIVSVFVVIAVSGHLEGKPEWFLDVFLIPFVAVGIGLIFLFLRQFLVTTGIGPTMVEISDHPLAPGGQYRLFVSQTGRLQVNSLVASLVCQEEATYRQGTDTRTETREVCREEVFRREAFDIQRGFPFEADIELTVPHGAMHSFKAEHNEIQWNLIVEGDIAGWPDYSRCFPVIIRPNDGRNEP